MLLETQKKQKKSKSVWKQEGGSVSNSGMIHVSDILPTIQKIEEELKIDIKHNLLGSAGKRMFSGDIDIAISDDTDKELFLQSLKNSNIFISVTGKSPISTLVKIENQNESIYKSVPYTGYVQVDFIFGNQEWLKIYYYSPDEKDSKYKGTYRNLLMASIAANVDTHKFEIPKKRKYIDRFKWSPKDGLVKVSRMYEYDDKKDSYKKKHTDYNISTCFQTEKEIIDILKLPNIESLHSFENLYSGIISSYDIETINTIIEDFVGSLNAKKLDIPIEIK